MLAKEPLLEAFFYLTNQDLCVHLYFYTARIKLLKERTLAHVWPVKTENKSFLETEDICLLREIFKSANLKSQKQKKWRS